MLEGFAILDDIGFSIVRGEPVAEGESMSKKQVEMVVASGLERRCTGVAFSKLRMGGAGGRQGRFR
jgi:hypothetical protein